MTDKTLKPCVCSCGSLPKIESYIDRLNGDSVCTIECSTPHKHAAPRWRAISAARRATDRTGVPPHILCIFKWNEATND